MKEINFPQFQNYEEEAKFWDQLDTADTMPDDDQWLHFDTPRQRALKVVILPGIAHELWEKASHGLAKRSVSSCIFTDLRE